LASERSFAALEAADTLTLLDLVPELAKAERVMTREVEEVAASPSANEVLEVVAVEEGVDDDTEVEFDLLLLLASLAITLSATAFSRTDTSLRFFDPLFVSVRPSEEGCSAFFLRIFTGFNGILIK
jgi:hypothetical protein